jgi:queuine tRNA-ribosyltransferase
MSVSFTIQKKCSSTKARLGHLKTAHADVETPIFMPVGTHAAIRSQRISEIEQMGFQMLLANTYHLILRPGASFFTNKGTGIREFSKWPYGFLTDSGGFQIFSLSHARKITEEGAVFRNHVNGEKIFLSPEISIEAQRAFQSDIMMVLDECVPSTTTYDDAARAMQLTHRWAKRSLVAKQDSTQGMFGIVQGACFEKLRIESAQAISEMPFCGIAIGGLAVGEGKDEREAMTGLVASYLPEGKPRYLMGVGTPLDILEAVSRGIDMFDCVLPTMLGQQGVAFNRTGKIDLRKSIFFDDQNPIDSQCDCFTCKNYTRSYLHHLIKTYDVSSHSWIGLHNIHFYGAIMNDIRTNLRQGTFGDYYEKTRKLFSEEEETTPGKIYEIVERKNRENKYVVSIRHRDSGEVMHSSEDPYRESNTLYVEQAKLKERFLSEPQVTIWDVGLGAATNAMGAISCWLALKEQGEKVCNLLIESFEITLEPLELVLSKKAKFPHAQHPWVTELYNQKKITAEQFQWNLYLDDFMKTYPAASLPDIVYYDPFSYKVDSPLWTYKTFQTLFASIGSGSWSGFTFSAATRVRAALLAAGFYVAYGSATGKKTETTVMLTAEAAKKESYPLLDAKWLSRWERSHSQFPADLEESEREDFIFRIRNHPQFI